MSACIHIGDPERCTHPARCPHCHLCSSCAAEWPGPYLSGYISSGMIGGLPGRIVTVIDRARIGSGVNIFAIRGVLA